MDRIGKGIREAPRDALVADLIPTESRGAAYGLRQALDTVGAVAGPLLAIVLMNLLAGDMRAVFWAATPPAILAVVLLVVAVQETEPGEPPRAVANPSSTPGALGRLPLRYWLIVLLGAVLTLARFSEAFLILRAGSLGLPAVWIPFVLVTMNIVYAAAAFPAGVAADHMSGRTLLALGLGILISADLLLAAAWNRSMLFAGIALWGLHLGLTQGLLATLVAATVPADLRGTGFGVFSLVTGVSLLAASTIAGLLWSHVGPPVTFLAGAFFAAIAMAGLPLLHSEPGAVAKA
jgi:MFS family permease